MNGTHWPVLDSLVHSCHGDLGGTDARATLGDLHGGTVRAWSPKASASRVSGVPGDRGALASRG